MIHSAFHAVIVLSSVSRETRRGAPSRPKWSSLQKAIIISKLTTLSVKVFLHREADGDLFTRGMTRDLLSGLAYPTRLSVDVALRGKVVVITPVACKSGQCSLGWWGNLIIEPTSWCLVARVT